MVRSATGVENFHCFFLDISMLEDVAAYMANTEDACKIIPMMLSEYQREASHSTRFNYQQLIYVQLTYVDRRFIAGTIN